MKKLYTNIEDIHIRGDISQLSEIVSVMDISLQDIADKSDLLAEYLVKYSTSNKGSQYAKVVKTALDLRDELHHASINLNDMQNQIVAYQNKIYRYEGMSECAPPPNKYLVTKRQINVDTSIIQFNRADMIDVAAKLKSYSEIVYHNTKTIHEKKNSIANIWRDTQYNDFAEFINTVTSSIIEAIKLYEGYIIILENKIKELN